VRAASEVERESRYRECDLLIGVEARARVEAK
jgi:hypothetical protein